MTPPASLVAALRHLLRPLVRLLTSQGVTYPMLADLLKQTYVDVAVQRWREATGYAAVLAGDGRSFEEVQLARSADGAPGSGA